MKTISTLVSLILIVLTCATSAILYLNESYYFSAILSCVWITGLTVWIGDKVGFVEQVLNRYLVRNTK